MCNNCVTVELESVTNTCFVVMPYHALFEAEYSRVIRPAIEEVGLKCVRGDEIYNNQAIIHDIWGSIRQARLVVAELSGRNPNVMYEIGLAHAIGKPIILLTRNQEDVPFDLKALRYLFYDTNDPNWGHNLRTEIAKKVRDVLQTPSLSAHLPGININNIKWPIAPNELLAPQYAAEPIDLSGVWKTSWLSIKRERLHEATLVISPGHGSDFIATMTVSYVRDEVRTIVQEMMTGSIRDNKLILTGVSFTFVDQGKALYYSLDSFDLSISDDIETMSGLARLRHGNRNVVFERLNSVNKPCSNSEQIAYLARL